MSGQPQRRLSILRLLLVFAVCAGVAFPVTRWVMSAVEQARAEPVTTWVAPYVDVSLPPTLHFEDPAAQPAANVVLGFVVADPSDPCAPSWGTYFSLDAAARALDLDRRVVRLRERGGDAVVSFGGALNSELAVACTDVDRLVDAYQAVVDRYTLTAVDFDIEGAAIADGEANARRSEAIRRLQEKDPSLEVWFTLPVATSGLTVESVNLLDQSVAAGVSLTGVNVMTMNYGGSRTPDTSMYDATVAALNATWQQLDGVYRRAGAPKTEHELWRMIGATPMIGQNDVREDVFTLDDADALVSFAARVDLGRLSFWSANRDSACGVGVDDARVSNTCSGLDQDPLAFASAFLADDSAAEEVETPAPENQDGDATSRDDPRTSPYPLWRSGRAYEEGDKVVWQGRVYQAKWYSQGEQPDAPVKNVWDTPWRYLGPVLESDRQAVRDKTPAPDGQRPKWAADTIYVAGDEVEHDKQIFRAKWWTQGDIPQEDPDQPYDHPWEYIGEVPTPTPGP